VGLVLALIGVVIVNRAFSDLDSSVGEMAGDRAEEILAKDLDVQFGKFVSDENPSLESGKLPVTLTNKGNDNAAFSVQLEAVDMFVLITSNKLSDMKRATFRIVEVSKY
jgi:hypothetical protein